MTFWLIVAGVGLLGIIGAYIFGRSDGRHAERLSTLNTQITAAERISDAQANAPTTHDAVVDELRNGGVL